MSEDGSLSQEEIDALLNMGDDDAPSGGGASAGGGGGSAGGADDLNLDSLLGGDGGGAGLDAASLSALAGAVGGGKPAPSGGGGGGRTAVASEGSRDNVELLLDVTLRFTVELGRTQMYIKDVLLLGEGSIVELDKNVGDEVDILINDRLFGRGRLVVMDEFFAVHITQIIDPLIRYRAM